LICQKTDETVKTMGMARSLEAIEHGQVSKIV